MLQRTNYNPGDNELLELISNNSLNRNQDIADMLHLLMNIDKGLSIFLDGDWDLVNIFRQILNRH